MFGRDYGLVEEFMMDDADIALVTVGATTGTAREAVKRMRSEGKNVGLIKIRCLRPFPIDYFQSLAGRVKRLAVLDRSMPTGQIGQIATDIMAALHGVDGSPEVYSFIAGIGGREITMDAIEHAADRTLRGEKPKYAEWLSLKKELV